MGSDHDEQRAMTEARARGAILDEVEGIGAMADRDYRHAAELFSRAEPLAAQGDRLRKFRINRSLAGR